LKTKIIGQGKFMLKLMPRRIRILLGVLHIPILAINFMFASKMENVGVKAMFEKNIYRMVQEQWY